MSNKEERRKQRLGDSIVRFMDKHHKCEVVVVDSSDGPLGVEVMRVDGARLSRQQEQDLGDFLRGYAIFQPMKKEKK
ncbi:hypothetical protein ACIPY3_02535 [Paenarthrobacter sp. NPDC089714]|uniref:hypothetical protein n=1 Tax=Paenarthrobacter sp. NPDC089714 TaxID=3364377 RepID=UPI0038170ECC